MKTEEVLDTGLEQDSGIRIHMLTNDQGEHILVKKTSYPEEGRECALFVATPDCMEYVEKDYSENLSAKPMSFDEALDYLEEAKQLKGICVVYAEDGPLKLADVFLRRNDNSESS